MLRENFKITRRSIRLTFFIVVTTIIFCIIVRQHHLIKLLSSHKRTKSNVCRIIPVLKKDKLPINNFSLPFTLMPAVYGDDRQVMTSLPPLDNIPKIFHFTWKNNRLPKQCVANIQEWRRLHPDWTFIFWTDADVKKFMDTALVDSILVKQWRYYPYDIMRVDFFRYVILYLIGGVYADIDVRPKRPLDPVIRHHSCILVREPEIFALTVNHNSALLVSNFLMASRPGHPFWPILMDKIKQSKSRNILFRTGPVAVHDAVRFYKETHPWVFRDASVFVAPSVYFEPWSNPKGHPIHYKFMKTRDCPVAAKRKTTRPYMKHICDVLRREDRFDWDVQYSYPRHFPGKFTEHQKLDSYGSFYWKRVTSLVLISKLPLNLVSPMKIIRSYKITDLFQIDEKIMNRKLDKEIRNTKEILNAI